MAALKFRRVENGLIKNLDMSSRQCKHKVSATRHRNCVTSRRILYKRGLKAVTPTHWGTLYRLAPTPTVQNLQTNDRLITSDNIFVIQRLRIFVALYPVYQF